MFGMVWDIPLYSGDTGKRTRRKLAGYKNDFMFYNVFSRLIKDGLHRYRIFGLPDTVSERVVLQSLMWYGGVVFFEWKGGLFALPGSPAGNYNIYGDMATAWVFSRNAAFNRQIDLFIPGSDKNAFLDKLNGGQTQTGKSKGVFIWENAIRYPFINQTIFFAEAIADTMRTIDVCRENIKSPFIILAQESEVNAVKRALHERKENVAAIIGTFDVSKIVLLPINQSSDSLNSCTALVEWYESKYRELCGIRNNSQIDKKGENLISDEIAVNEEYTYMQPDESIKYIQNGLDICNDIWGLNMQVKTDEKRVFNGLETGFSYNMTERGEKNV